MSESTVMSVELRDGCLYVVRRYPSKANYACSPPQPVPDRVEREIYSANGGVISLVMVEKGRVVPARMSPESVEFDT